MRFWGLATHPGSFLPSLCPVQACNCPSLSPACKEAAEGSLPCLCPLESSKDSPFGFLFPLGGP